MFHFRDQQLSAQSRGRRKARADAREDVVKTSVTVRGGLEVCRGPERIAG